MSEQLPVDPVDDKLRDLAQRFSYPPTPDIAQSVSRKLASEGAFDKKRAGEARDERSWRPRLAFAPVALVIALLFVGALAVPEVQAFVRSVLRIGVIDIVEGTPIAGSPGPMPSPVMGLDLRGETTLEGARAKIFFPIKLPTYPSDLGPPDRVFVQETEGDALVLAWLDPAREDTARMILDELGSDVLAQKTLSMGYKLQETTVNGQSAVWIGSVHILDFYNRNSGTESELRRLINGPVLLWSEGGITYRLQSDLSLVEAVKVAESLKALPGEPEATPMPYSILSLQGETSLEAAQQEIGAPFKLPAYPADLGMPDKVFMQYTSRGPIGVLVWLEPGQQDRVRMVLYRVISRSPGGTQAGDGDVIEETQVNGERAEWSQELPKLNLKDVRGRQGVYPSGMPDAHVLSWTQDGVTYWLESGLSKEEAVKVAESMK
ncbi:MAG TPA: DUF4367 domain-containing protein [Chloroflexia bacterium]|nr:DUF4367 domain-containing protein [Chloroflexia bacterium]